MTTSPSNILDSAMEAAHKAWREQAKQDGTIFEYNLRAAIEAAAHVIAAEALEEAADEADGIIACGDIAECAAPVDGESGRYEAVAARDSLYEEPSYWLRARAASIRAAK